MLALPIVAEWEAKRLAPLRAMHDGLRGAGLDARLEAIGTTERPLQLLRVQTPAHWLEEADAWLLRAIARWEQAEAWASSVWCVLHRDRWPDFGVWSGSEDECASISSNVPVVSDARWPGARLAVVRGAQRGISIFPRGVTATLPNVPGAAVARESPSADRRARTWVAIDEANAGETTAHRQLQIILEGVGVATQRWDLSHDRSLLTLEVGDDWLDQFEERLVQRFAATGTPWPSRLRRWSWFGTIAVHRHPAPEGWRVREWLEQQLGVPCVSARELAGSDEITIQVPAAFVDRAITILRERFR